MVKRLLFWLLFSFLTWTSFAGGRIELRLMDTLNFLNDQTYLSFDQGQSNSYVLNQDAVKILAIDSTVPQLYSFTSDGIMTLSNGLEEFTGCTVVPLGYRIPPATYRISQLLFTGFEAGTILRLEDRTRGVFHNLLSSDYVFTATQFEHSNGRFFLHISPAPVVTSTAAGCDNNDGVITVNQETCLEWTICQLYFGNQPISSLTNATGTFSFTGLEEGEYNLAFSLGAYIVTIPVDVAGHQVQARINASAGTAVTGETISFSAIATNADGFAWDFGDGTQMTGVANPDYFYNDTGTYTVTLICTNSFGCSDTATFTLSIEQGTGIDETALSKARIIYDGQTLHVQLAEITSDARIDLYTLNGNLLFHSPLYSDKFCLPSLSRGMYLVALRSGGQQAIRKTVIY